jgi:hypothetical protein
MTDADAVMNDETRRALWRRIRQAGMLVVGALVAIVIFGVAGLAAILSVPWQLSLALTAGVTVAIPAAVPYAMLRMLGLSHQDVLYVGKQVYREGVAEVIALSGTRKTADVFTKSIALDEETESSSSEAKEMDAEETSTKSEPTDQSQQAEPEPQSS